MFQQAHLHVLADEPRSPSHLRACPACQGGNLKHYVYVSSAGAYKANSVEPMHVEGDARKSSAGGQQGAAAVGGATS